MRQNYSTNLLPGDYIAGFVDGEGCFYIQYRIDRKQSRAGSPIYYRWLSYFVIALREDDLKILQRIQETLGCGRIYFLNRKGGKRIAYFAVQNLNDLYIKVMPFFKKYSLRAKKASDFALWCDALGIIYQHKIKKKPYTTKEQRKLLALREAMREYKATLDREYKNLPMF